MNLSSWKFNKTTFFAGILTLTVSLASGQANRIAQDSALFKFFASLDRSDSMVVSILHLGDSHIQAGFFPEATASLLQRDFGDAGRGWVFPWNLANTNGPGDYRWNSTARWSADRIIDKYKPAVLGPGAIVISSTQSSPALAYNRREDSPENDISQAELFYDAGPEEATVVAPGADINIFGPPFRNASSTVKVATLNFEEPVQNFQVRWDDKGSQPFHFYGALLFNGKPGVQYNAVGINGAMYSQYNDANNTLVAEMDVMKPQLVIISLGTNEAYSSLNAANFRDQIDSTVTVIRRYQPGASILLTTPPECKRVSKRAFKKKVGKRYKTYYKISYYPNPYIAVVTQQIMSYCKEKGIACWNFNAENRFRESEFAGGWSPDHIHFNVRGYQLQGKLLYEALHQSYLKYKKYATAHYNVNEDDDRAE